jgi:hypothetical protein
MRNQPDSVIDDLAAMLTQQQEGSLTSGESSQEQQTQEQEQAQSAPAQEEVPTEAVQQTEQTQVSFEEYEEMKKQLEELKGKTGEAVDYSWFNTNEGKLFLTDFDNVDIEDSAYDFNVRALMESEGYSEEEAIEELEYRFPNLLDEDADEDSREYKAEYRKFLSDARSRVEELKSKKAELKVPFSQSSKEGQIANEDFDKVYGDRLTQDYQNRAQMRSQIANELVSDKNEVKLKIGEYEMDYELSDTVKQSIISDLTNLENIGSQFVKGDEIDNQGLLTFLLLKNDPETIINIAASMKAAQTKEQVIKNEIKNTNFTPKAPRADTGNPYPEGHRLHDAFNAMLKG